MAPRLRRARHDASTASVQARAVHCRIPRACARRCSSAATRTSRNAVAGRRRSAERAVVRTLFTHRQFVSVQTKAPAGCAEGARLYAHRLPAQRLAQFRARASAAAGGGTGSARGWCSRHRAAARGTPASAAACTPGHAGRSPPQRLCTPAWTGSPARARTGTPPRCTAPLETGDTPACVPG